MTDTTSTAPAIRFARLPRRGVLLGFSALRLASLGVAVAALVPALFVAGSQGAALTMPLWGGAIAAAFVPWRGTPLIEWVPTALHYAWRGATSQTRFRARPDRPRPAGTLALPGDAAALRFLIDSETGAAMLHDPHAQTLTVVALLRHPSFILQSPDEQARRVHGWSRTLAHLAATGSGTRVQILEVTLPDAGRGITGWWETHASAERGGWVARQYEELMTTVVPSASTHRTLAALSLDLRKARPLIRQSGRGLAGAAAFLKQEMTSFHASLRAAEIRLDSWLGEEDVAATLRTAYDPGFGATDQATAKLATAGPVAVDEHWGHVRHDTGHSAVLWVSEWPRVAAPPHFLHSLVFQPGIRKTISMTYEPIPADEAIRDIRRAKVEYATDAAQKAKLGVIADLSDSVEASDVVDRERALIAGHADIRFTGLVVTYSVNGTLKRGV